MSNSSQKFPFTTPIGDVLIFQKMTKVDFRTYQTVFSKFTKVVHFKEIDSAAKTIEEFTH